MHDHYGANYPYKVSIIDGLIAFIHLDLTEIDELTWDEDYDEVGGLAAYQRLYVFVKIPNGEVPQEIKQMYLFDEAVVEGFQKTEKATPLGEAFGIPAGYVEHIKHTDAKMFKQYMLNSAYDALSLEFYQMLDRNVKLKRCKNCDPFFLVKSKRNTDYCDRLANGGT